MSNLIKINRLVQMLLPADRYYRKLVKMPFPVHRNNEIAYLLQQ